MSGQSVRNEDSERKSHRSATWDQEVGRRLIGCAARKAPPGLRERLEEEWLADLTARQGAFSRIRFGLGCCWATRVIAREFGAAAAATAGSPSGQRLLIAHGGYDFSRFSRRSAALVAIVCLHAALVRDFLTPKTSIPRRRGVWVKPARRSSASVSTLEGVLTAAPSVLQSSGIGQIDQGALRLARAGSGRYRPTTDNGQPVSACYAFRIRFQLEGQ